jgi:hypothetical protein
LDLGILDPERVVVVIVDVFDRVWALGTKQFCLGLLVSATCRREINPRMVCGVIPEPSWTIDDHHAGIPVSVLRFADAGGHDDLEDPNAALIEDDTVGFWRSPDTVKLIGPGPGGEFLSHRATATLALAVCSTVRWCRDTGSR